MAKIEKTVELNVEASQAEKALNKFGKSIESIREEEFEPLNFAIGELEDRLYEMASAGKAGTKEFNEMAAEVGRMKKVIIDTDLAVDGMAQTMAQNLGGAMGGIASGFELAQGAMGAFGASGEAVEEALLKVQSAMAISQGIQGIKESIASFKALRTAVMSNVVVQKVLNVVMSMNPIGLIIAGVVALGAAIAALWSPIKKLGQFFGLVAEDAESAEEMNDRLTESFERQAEAMERANQKMERIMSNRKRLLDIQHKEELRQLERLGAGEEEIAELKKKQLAEQLEAEEEGLKEKERQRQQDINSALNQIELRRKAAKKAHIEGEYELYRQINDEIEAQRKKYKELKNLDGQFNKDLEALHLEHTGNIADIDDAESQRRKDAYKKNLQDRLSALRQIQDLELELMKEGQEKELAEMNKGFDRAIEDTKSDENLRQSEKEKIIALYEQQRTQKEKEIRDKYIADEKAKEEQAQKARLEAQKALRDAQQAWADEEEAFYEEYRQNTLSKDQLEIEAVQEKYFRLIELAKQYGLDTVELERKQAEEIEAINAASVDNQKEKDKELQQAKLDTAIMALSGINDIVQAFAGEDEARQKKAFQINKAVNIAQATMEGYRAVVSTFASTPGGPLIKGIAAASVGAAAFANVANIAKTKFQSSGSGGSGASASAPNIPSAAGGSPTFNIVGDTGVNQLAETLGQQNQQPVKAYVVGQDVTTQQSLDRNITATASI